MGIDVPNELKAFHKIFEKLTYRHEHYKVFEHFLDFIIWMYDVRQLDVPDSREKWDKSQYPYSKEEIKLFNELFCEWINVQNNQIVGTKDWYDLFGTYYMAVIVSKMKQSGAGQFFTPETVCNFMAEVILSNDKDKTGQMFNDCAGGSGRFFLALHTKSPGNYHVAQDLDLTCCKMTIANFLIHGVVGEVVWMNSLTGEYFNGWKVNEWLNSFLPMPHIRNVKQHELELFKTNAQVKTIEKPVEAINEIKGPVTLDSFMEAAK